MQYAGTYPFQEIKVNSAGILQWTYTSTFAYSYGTGFSFLGGFCIDGYSGKGFMSEGFDGSGAQIISTSRMQARNYLYKTACTHMTKYGNSVLIIVPNKV